MRRIHDAGFPTPYAGIPILVYWINMFGLAFIEHGSKWTLLILAFIITLGMATISNARIRHNYQYKFGYHGPVNLEENIDQSVPNDRIEPTIAGNKASQDNSTQTQMHNRPNLFGEQENDVIAQSNLISDESNSPTAQQNTWEGQLGLWFIANKTISLAGISAITLLVLILVLMSTFSAPPPNPIPIDSVKAATVKQRLQKLEMPDQFFLMMDENDSLTIAWEGDYKKEGEYWSAYTGKGDIECLNLHFSLGEDFKTLLVTVKNNGDYYADFSPTDTAKIVKSIADKDRFKLCGYEFVLSGTRSILRQNRKYLEYLKAS